MNRHRTMVLVFSAFMFSIAYKAATGAVIADSLTDFSGVQGQENWYYGFYDGDSVAPFTQGDFEQLPIFALNEWRRSDSPGSSGSYWTSMRPASAIPNGTIPGELGIRELNWAVRRYVSEIAGLVNISGEFQDLFNTVLNDNGIIARIIIDDVEVLTREFDHGFFSTYQIQVPVEVGSVVDFIVDPRQGNDRYDITQFTVTISTVPEPASSTLAALSVLLGCLVCVRVR
jgi:hypothetical protein